MPVSETVDPDFGGELAVTTVLAPADSGGSIPGPHLTLNTQNVLFAPPPQTADRCGFFFFFLYTLDDFLTISVLLQVTGVTRKTILWRF